MLFKEYLESINACHDAVDWAGGKTLDDCWQTCDRPDWMLWLYERNTPDKMTCVKIAVYAARLVLPLWQEKYPEDLRPQRAIEAAEKWVENLSEETRQAAVAAGAWAAVSGARAAGAWAAWAVAAERAAAADAARAAGAWAAGAGAWAAGAAWAAAADAAWAAAADAAWAAGSWAAGDNVNKTIADYIRTLIPTINIPEVTDEKSV